MAETAPAPQLGKPIIEIRNLRKIYQREKQEVVVLDGIDLDVPEGAFEALMGPSGSGKTTLLNLIAGIDKPSSGSIYADLGVRTLINGRGVATFYSGTLMPPEVHRAMERASEHFVEIIELQKAVGARLAQYAGTEAAMVSSGSAACIAQATAGCLAGTDPDKISRLPDTSGKQLED